MNEERVVLETGFVCSFLLLFAVCELATACFDAFVGRAACMRSTASSNNFFVSEYACFALAFCCICACVVATRYMQDFRVSKIATRAGRMKNQSGMPRGSGLFSPIFSIRRTVSNPMYPNSPENMGGKSLGRLWLEIRDWLNMLRKAANPCCGTGLNFFSSAVCMTCRLPASPRSSKSGARAIML